MSVFRIKTAIHHGVGALDVLSVFSGKRVLIVTDKFLSTSPMIDLVRSKMVGAEISVFADVIPDPTIDVVTAGLHAFMAAHPEALIALGGGSPIDAAKAIHRIVRKQGLNDCACIAIPTTSGSGSEVTSVSVITDAKTHRKLPLISQSMLPDIAILDPELTASVPAGVTADTGMDALTHAVEAYVSTQACDFTDAFAEKSIQLVFAYLPRAVADGADAEAREHLHNASNMAALAFDHAGLGITHSLAHALGGEFQLPHGRLNAMLLPHVIEFNAGRLGVGEFSHTALRYAKLGRMIRVSGATTRPQVTGFINAVRRLAHDLGIGDSLTRLGVDKAAYLKIVDSLAATALDDACTETNPVPVTAADLAGIYRKLG